MLSDVNAYITISVSIAENIRLNKDCVRKQSYFTPLETQKSSDVIALELCFHNIMNLPHHGKEPIETAIHCNYLQKDISTNSVSKGIGQLNKHAEQVRVLF